MKGMKRYKIPTVKYISHGDEIHSTGNINNIGITLYGDIWK